MQRFKPYAVFVRIVRILQFLSFCLQKSDRDRDRNRENEDRYPRGRRRSSADREKEAAEREKSAPSAHIMVRGSASALTKEEEVCYLLLTISLMP